MELPISTLPNKKRKRITIDKIIKDNEKEAEFVLPKYL
jgi:hypothetical protein